MQMSIVCTKARGRGRWGGGVLSGKGEVLWELSETPLALDPGSTAGILSRILKIGGFLKSSVHLCHAERPRALSEKGGLIASMPPASYPGSAELGQPGLNAPGCDPPPSSEPS